MFAIQNPQPEPVATKKAIIEQPKLNLVDLQLTLLHELKVKSEIKFCWLPSEVIENVGLQIDMIDNDLRNYKLQGENQ